MVNFSIKNISDIIDTLDSKLYEYGYDNNARIEISVNKQEFRKIDEELYYRQFPDGKDFVPSEEEIIVTSGRVCLVVRLLSPQEVSSGASKTEA